MKKMLIVTALLTLTLVCASCMIVLSSNGQTGSNDQEGSVDQDISDDPVLGSSSDPVKIELGNSVYGEYYSDSHQLRICGSGATYDFNNMPSSLIFNALRISTQSVVIEYGVTEITGLFKDYKNLEKVLIWPNIKIGSHTFDGCSSLKEIDFQKMTYIGDYAFSGCKSLEKVYADKATSIGAYAFNDCESIRILDVSNATTIGHHAFKDCSSIRLIEELNVSRVESGVFMGCLSLRFVNFVQPVNYFGDDAFHTCASLLRIPFETPDNDTISVGPHAFDGCLYLSSFPFDKVEYIGDGAFRSCSRLTELNLPVCTHIGSGAFRGSGIVTAVLNKSIDVIGETTFERSGLKSIEFQGKVVIKDNAFRHCGNLESVNMENVKSLGSHSFEGTKLTSISFNSDVKYISESAFEGCSSLKSIEFNSIVDIGNRAFYKSALSDVPLQYIRNIGSYAFAECDNIKTLDFPKTGYVKISIQDHAFMNCNIEQLEIGDSVDYIGNEAFFNDKNPMLSRIVLGNGLKSIDAHAFGYDILDTHGRKIVDAKDLNGKILVKNGASYTAYTKALVDIGENIIFSYGNEMHSNEKVYLGVGEEIVFGFDHKAGYKYVLTINGEVVENSGMFQRWIVTGDAEFRVEYIPLFKQQSSQSDMNEIDSYSLPNVTIDNSPSMENWTLSSNLNPMLPSNEFKHAYSFPQAKSY